MRVVTGMISVTVRTVDSVTSATVDESSVVTVSPDADDIVREVSDVGEGDNVDDESAIDDIVVVVLGEVDTEIFQPGVTADVVSAAEMEIKTFQS